MRVPIALPTLVVALVTVGADARQPGPASPAQPAAPASEPPRPPPRPDTGSGPGDAVISGSAGGSEIVITTTTRLAGAIHSLRWGGREFIDSHDHGRQLQSASNLDVDGKLFNETFNPTEAGAERDQAGPASTSRLLWLSAGGRELQTVSRMAFWLRPGQSSGDHPALNTTALSNHLLQKRVVIGADGLEHAVRHEITFTLPSDERHTRCTFEVLTGYMPGEFSAFHVLRADDALEALPDGQGEQSLPVVVSTADGGHAMGVWSPAVARTTGAAATYGRFAFPHAGVTKWNVVVRESRPAGLETGAWRHVAWVAVGNREQVRATLAELRRRK